MKNLFITVTLLLSLSASAFSFNYIDEKTAAKKLMSEKKIAEAMTAFEELAGKEITDRQKSDALSYAIKCGFSLKSYDKCKELAEQIPLKSYKVLRFLQIYDRTREKKKAIEKYKDIDVEKMIELLRGDIYFSRGLAYLFTRDYENAKKDFEAALNYLKDPNTVPMTVNHLASIYMNHDKDPEKAIATFRSVYKMRQKYKAAQAAMGASGILKSLGKYDEALKELEKIDKSALGNNVFGWQYLFAKGGILEKKGDTEKAIAIYKDLAEKKNLSGYMKKSINKSLIELGVIKPEK